MRGNGIERHSHSSLVEKNETVFVTGLVVPHIRWTTITQHYFQFGSTAQRLGTRRMKCVSAAKCHKRQDSSSSKLCIFVHYSNIIELVMKWCRCATFQWWISIHSVVTHLDKSCWELRPTKCCFYPNVTMVRSGLCYCKSVCLSSLTFVRPTQGVETFGNISLPFCTLAILWPLCKILPWSSQGTPPLGAWNARGVAK